MQIHLAIKMLKFKISFRFPVWYHIFTFENIIHYNNYHYNNVT